MQKIFINKTEDLKYRFLSTCVLESLWSFSVSLYSFSPSYSFFVLLCGIYDILKKKELSFAWEKNCVAFYIRPNIVYHHDSVEKWTL